MEVNMFLKNNMRPAFASASACGQANSRKAQNDALMYDTAAPETDDFGSFNSGAPSSPARQRKTGAKKPTQSFKPSAIVIAVAAIAVVLLLVILVAALALGGGKDIKYENNSFVSFSDTDGIWRVAANGKVVGEYEHEIELIPATDRSFAYVIENDDNGYRVTVTDGKSTTEIIDTPVTRVLATAGLEVGVVYLDDGSIYRYTEEYGEERVVKNADQVILSAPSNVIGEKTPVYISDDAQTVTYSRYIESDLDSAYVCAYKESFETKLQKGALPEAISADGSLIYVSGRRAGDVADSLYVLTVNEDSDRRLITGNFRSIVSMNVAGDEIVLTTVSDSSSDKITTAVAVFNPKSTAEIVPTTICKQWFDVTPISVDPEVARPDTFADSYFKANISALDMQDNECPLYYLNKKFESRSIARYNGKFDHKGDYFYYVNNKGTLLRIDLSNTDGVSEEVTDAVVVDFEITEKGNLYLLEDTTKLLYFNVSSKKRVSISEDVTAISMHRYSNKLYFTLDEEIAQSVYVTEEGSKKENVSFDDTSVTGLPVFVDINAKKTFAIYFDGSNESWRMYYTSNGKSFKYVSPCSEIPGYDGTFSDNFVDDMPSETPDAEEGQ